MFDIMDLEDDERNELLQLPDSKMQVRKCDCLFVDSGVNIQPYLI